MKKQFIIPMLMLGLLGGLLMGCSKEDEDFLVETPKVEAISTPEPVETPEPTPTPNTEIITERMVVDGQMQSYLTGEWKDEAIVNRRPIAVMVPNNAPALPQYGLSLASIIYEAPVEGRITRIMPVFEDFDDLDRIGPIRSSRDYFIYQALGYQAIYCNWGLARPYVEELINSDRVQNISAAVEGIHHPADEAFGRVKRSGYAIEFTGYLFIDGMLEAADRLGYTWEYGEDHRPAYTFAGDGHRAEDRYEDLPKASVIRPGGTDNNKGGYGAYNPYFEYHEEDRLYYRFQDGKAQIDEYNGEQLTFSNVVLQYCHGEGRDDHDYLAFGVHGEGEAIVFTGGRVIEGTWKRLDGDNTPAVFYDEKGEEVIFNQGKTWVCNIWQEYSDSVSYE